MNIKKYAVVAALMMLCASSYADTNIGQSTLPENVATVYPQPDNRVNLGPNASPLGLQQISVLFKREVSVNPNCDGIACIYHEGDDTPIQTVGISGASVDFTQPKMGGVMFPYSCRENGFYRVTIPEGFWIISGDTPAYSGALDLHYEILNPQKISPSETIVAELSEFKLEFPGYQEARLLKANNIEFFRHSSPSSYPLTITEGKNDDGSPANFILIKLNTPVSEQGDYSLFVKAGAAEGVNNPGTDLEVSDKNLEALYQYTVSHINAPTIVPAEGPVERFVPFELTVPEGSDFWFVNDRAVSFIYPVNEDGSLAPDATYRLTAARKGESDVITLTINENGNLLEDVVPQPGNYALQLANGLFSGSWHGEFINSAPFTYYFNVLSDPDSVDQTPASSLHITNAKGIYSIDGKKISDASDPDLTDNLPNGIYIIDGKKTYISGKGVKQ